MPRTPKIIAAGMCALLVLLGACGGPAPAPEPEAADSAVEETAAEPEEIQAASDAVTEMDFEDGKLPDDGATADEESGQQAPEETPAEDPGS